MDENLNDLIEQKHIVVKGMRKYGGSFVNALGNALMAADDVNTLKIKNAFPEYWEKYLEMGKE